MSEYTNSSGRAILYFRLLRLLLAKPEDIKRGIRVLKEEQKLRHLSSQEEVNLYNTLTEKIITVASCSTATVGGVTALPGALPGYGLILGFGSAQADAKSCKRLHRNMITAIAAVWGYDVHLDRNIGVDAYLDKLERFSSSLVVGGTLLGSGLCARIVQQNLKGASLRAVKSVCKKVGVRFTRKAFVQKVPLGVGTVVSVSCNMASTRYLGHKAKRFFSTLYVSGEELTGL